MARKNWAQGGARSSQLLVFLLTTCGIELLVSLTGVSGWVNMLYSKGLWRAQKLLTGVWT